MNKKNKPIGEILKDRGVITQAHIDFALSIANVTQVKFGNVLSDAGLISESDISEALAEQANLKYVDVDFYNPDSELLEKIEKRTCENLKILPIRREPTGEIFTIIGDVPDKTHREAISKRIGGIPSFYISDESKVLSAINNAYHFLKNPIEEKLAQTAKKLSKLGTITNTTELIDNILLLAIKKRATDIHIQPVELGYGLSLRIDGVLVPVLFFPRIFMQVVRAIKFAAEMDTSDKKPCDGRLSKELLGKEYDIRISTIPTLHGENVVMRLLSRRQSMYNLHKLGFMEMEINVLKEVFNQPHGIVILTGPTGSGKSTTMNAGIATLDLIGKNVVTIENPIEYIVPLARQTQVNEASKYTFSNSMKYFLRHDPDVIMVGEIRDEETAKMAMTASMTGHLVLTTLHTNSAIGAIPRLHGLNIDDITLAETLVCIVSQRLVRTVCQNCTKDLTELSQIDIDIFGKDIAHKIEEGKVNMKKAVGCPSCNDTGYAGRTLVYEILHLNEEARKKLLSPPYSLEEIRKLCIVNGKTILDIAKEKVLMGITTSQEIKRVLGSEF